MKKLLLITILCISNLLCSAQWSLISLPLHSSFKIHDLHAFNENNIVACAYNGSGTIMCRTADGGSTWHFDTIEIWVRIVDITFINTDTGYAVGRPGVLYHTTDGGYNWSLYKDFYPYWDLRKIEFISSNKAFIVGDPSLCSTCNNVLLRTNDAWNTFEEVEYPTIEYLPPNGIIGSYLSLFFTDSLHGYAAGNNEPLLRTNDGGATWFWEDFVENLNTLFVSYTIFNNTIWAGSWGDINCQALNVYKSNNWGDTWTHASEDINGVANGVATAHDMQAISDSIIYAACGPNIFDSNQFPQIIVSKDGGTTWEVELYPTPQLIGPGSFLSIECPTPKICIIGCPAPYILKKSNADFGTTSVTETINEKNSLSVYQNSSEGTYNYILNKTGATPLLVYNHISTQVMSFVPTATSGSISLSQYPSGIYIFKYGPSTVKIIKQ